MMFPGWGMSGWMMASYGLLLLLVVAAAVVAVIAGLRRSRTSARAISGPTAAQLLAQRYAQGEIDDDEYFQRLSVLESTNTPAGRMK